MFEAVEAIVEQLETAWNAGSGQDFAAPFAEDADFVTVYGFHAHGRDGIAAGHDAIFRSVYRGSTVHYAVEQVRTLAPDVTLAHLNARLSVPDGVMKGEHEARPSIVLTRNGGGWQIASLHNTWVTTPPSS